MKNEDAAHNLHLQTEAAKALRANLKDIIAGDETLAADMVEGETSINEAIHAAVALVSQDETHIKAIDEHIKALEGRKHRLSERAKMTRTAIAAAMDQAGKKKVDTALGTVSVRSIPPSVQVTEEAEIPTEFWKQPEPKLDKKALLAALKDKQTIPGATLSNGGQTIAIKV